MGTMSPLGPWPNWDGERIGAIGQLGRRAAWEKSSEQRVDDAAMDIREAELATGV